MERPLAPATAEELDSPSICPGRPRGRGLYALVEHLIDTCAVALNSERPCSRIYIPLGRANQFREGVFRAAVQPRPWG